jgi:hypothetical protein
MSSNDLPDINYGFKTVCRNNNNVNDKSIKIIQAQPQTYTLNAGLSVALASYLILPYGNDVNLGEYYSVYLKQFQFVASASGSTFVLRAYLIDENFNEVIEDLPFSSGINVRISSGYYRNLNNIEIISGSLNSNLSLTAGPNQLNVTKSLAHQTCIIFGNGSTKWNCRFMCPKGKVAKLSSIDYYRCVNATPVHLSGDITLQIFRRVDSTAEQIVRSAPAFRYPKVLSPFNITYNIDGCCVLEYGDSVMFYREAVSGATDCSISATFTLYDA